MLSNITIYQQIHLHCYQIVSFFFQVLVTYAQSPIRQLMFRSLDGIIVPNCLSSGDSTDISTIK